MKVNSWLAKPKINVGIRTLLAVVGGYSASAALSLIFAHWIGFAAGREAEVFIRMMFFTLYTFLIIWVFSVKSEQKIIVQMLIVNLLSWLLVWMK